MTDLGTPPAHSRHPPTHTPHTPPARTAAPTDAHPPHTPGTHRPTPPTHSRRQTTAAEPAGRYSNPWSRAYATSWAREVRCVFCWM